MSRPPRATSCSGTTATAPSPKAHAPPGVVSFGWHSGAAVADVNGDGRPDLFVAGYTEPNAPIPGSSAGYPTNHLGVRDLLFVNEGNGRDGHAHFREVGRQAGLDPRPYDHSLGAVFTDVNADGRLDLYVANDEDPNRLYLERARPPAPLGFRSRRPRARQARARRPERRHGDRAPATSTATVRPTCSSRTRAGSRTPSSGSRRACVRQRTGRSSRPRSGRTSRAGATPGST